MWHPGPPHPQASLALDYTQLSCAKGEGFCQNNAMQVLAPLCLQIINSSLVTQLQHFGLVSNTTLLQIYQCQIEMGQQRLLFPFATVSVTLLLFWTTSILENRIVPGYWLGESNSVQRNCNPFSGFLSTWENCEALWGHPEMCIT